MIPQEDLASLPKNSKKAFVSFLQHNSFLGFTNEIFIQRSQLVLVQIYHQEDHAVAHPVHKSRRFRLQNREESSNLQATSFAQVKVFHSRQSWGEATCSLDWNCSEQEEYQVSKMVDYQDLDASILEANQTLKMLTLTINVKSTTYYQRAIGAEPQHFSKISQELTANGCRALDFVVCRHHHLWNSLSDRAEY